MIPIPRGGLFQNSPLIELSKAQEVVSDSFYLRATIDPNAHLALDARINFLAPLALVDSGATGVFMHPTCAAQCNAVIRPKVMPREVQVIDERVINLGLITH